MKHVSHNCCRVPLSFALCRLQWTISGRFFLLFSSLNICTSVYRFIDDWLDSALRCCAWLYQLSDIVILLFDLEHNAKRYPYACWAWVWSKHSSNLHKRRQPRRRSHLHKFWFRWDYGLMMPKLACDIRKDSIFSFIKLFIRINSNAGSNVFFPCIVVDYLASRSIV